MVAAAHRAALSGVVAAAHRAALSGVIAAAHRSFRSNRLHAVVAILLVADNRNIVSNDEDVIAVLLKLFDDAHRQFSGSFWGCGFHAHAAVFATAHRATLHPVTAHAVAAMFATAHRAAFHPVAALFAATHRAAFHPMAAHATMVAATHAVAAHAVTALFAATHRAALHPVAAMFATAHSHGSRTIGTFDNHIVIHPVHCIVFNDSLGIGRRETKQKQRSCNSGKTFSGFRFFLIHHLFPFFFDLYFSLLCHGHATGMATDMPYFISSIADIRYFPFFMTIVN